jgi:hypothetical protein
LLATSKTQTRRVAKAGAWTPSNPPWEGTRVKVQCRQFKRLSEVPVHFISGLMKHKVPFIVTELGADADPFLLHIYAALAERPDLAPHEGGTGG